MAIVDRLGNTVDDPGLAWKAPVVVATTGTNIVLSGVQTIDGVSVGNNNERVLVKDQTDATTNGIYHAGSGTWTRANDANSNTQWAQGTQVSAALGVTNALRVFVLTTANPIVLGTSLLTFKFQLTSAAWKVSARAATTGAITLSGLQTVDGVSLAGGDRVLVKNQADQTTNGIYIAGSGSWARSSDGASNSDWLQGTQVSIAQGTVNNQLTYMLTASNPIVLGSTNMTFGLSPNILFTSIADQTITGGANVTSDNLGTVSSGTVTVDCGARPLQYLTNNGAFTLAAPANDGSCIVLVTNGASAGAITFSGFSVGTFAGDTLDTTNGHKFSLSIWRINGVSGYRVSAHQ